jgi:hypothetical protein
MQADLLQIIANVVSYLIPFQQLFGVVCFIIAIVMMMSALKQAARVSEQRNSQMMGQQAGWSGPAVTFLIATGFAAMPGLLNTLSHTFFQAGIEDASSIFSHAPTTIGILDGGAATTLVVGIVRIIQFIGMIAIARGLLLLNQSTQGAGGPKTFGPSLTFVVAGAMATNFPLFMGAIEAIITP